MGQQFSMFVLKPLSSNLARLGRRRGCVCAGGSVSQGCQPYFPPLLPTLARHWPWALLTLPVSKGEQGVHARSGFWGSLVRVWGCTVNVSAVPPGLACRCTSRTWVPTASSSAGPRAPRSWTQGTCTSMSSTQACSSRQCGGWRHSLENQMNVLTLILPATSFLIWCVFSIINQ